jgi:hypothetical protein
MATKTKQCSIVVGVFHDRAAAQQALRDLKQAGFSEDQIGVVARHEEGEVALETPSGANMAAGAGIGAAAGAGIGALWALGIATLGFPALGPVLVGGTLVAAVLASAGGGAAVGTLLGALIGLGIPEEEAQFYEKEVHAGRTIVTVKADGRFDEAWNILNRQGAYDMHTAGASRTATEAAREASGTVVAASPDADWDVKQPSQPAGAAKQPANTGKGRARS